MPDDSRATVLVVDDEDDVAQAYAMYLEADYDVRVANNGGEALVELSEEVDVVLLDRRMPGMSGDEVLDHVEDWGFDCHVVMVTAIDPDEDIVDMPIDHYLPKPVGKEELRDTVEQLLLFDRYRELLLEFYSVCKKRALLASYLGGPGNEEVERLEARHDEIRRELQETVDRFTDEDAVSAFEAIHDVEH